jgi:hypothetical protein
MRRRRNCGAASWRRAAGDWRRQVPVLFFAVQATRGTGSCGASRRMHLPTNFVNRGTGAVGCLSPFSHYKSKEGQAAAATSPRGRLPVASAMGDWRVRGPGDQAHAEGLSQSLDRGFVYANDLCIHRGPTPGQAASAGPRMHLPTNLVKGGTGAFRCLSSFSQYKSKGGQAPAAPVPARSASALMKWGDWHTVPVTAVFTRVLPGGSPRLHLSSASAIGNSKGGQAPAAPVSARSASALMKWRDWHTVPVTAVFTCVLSGGSPRLHLSSASAIGNWQSLPVTALFTRIMAGGSDHIRCHRKHHECLRNAGHRTPAQATFCAPAHSTENRYRVSCR